MANSKNVKSSEMQDRSFDTEEVQTRFPKGKDSYRNRKPRYNAGHPRSYSRNDNDWSWYAKNAQLLKDAASYSFNRPNGIPVDLANENCGAVLGLSSRQPGICAINLAPTIGISTDAQSPINVAAKNIYSYVRHANSGHTNYDSPDLMCYLTAASSAFSFYAFLARIYGLMNLYSPKNRYLPKMLVEAMNVDYDSILSNLSDFRYQINTLANKLAALYVPSTMPYFTRHYWVYSHVWADSPNAKAQLYEYTPVGFWSWSPRTSSTGSSLTLLPLKKCAFGQSLQPRATYASLTGMLNTIINALLGDEDVGIMSGDIKKAYGDKLLYVTTIPEGYSVAPEYNMEVLGQIHNSVSVGWAQSLSNFSVTQDTDGNLIQTLKCAGHLGTAISKVFNSKNEVVEPAEVMVGTRLTTCCSAPYEWTYSTAAYCGYDVLSCGSEVVVDYTIYRLSPSSQLGYAALDAQSYMPRDAAYESNMNMLASWSQFDWAPIIYTYEPIGTLEYQNVAIFGDLDNWTVLGPTDIDKLHMTALLSEFGVPQDYVVK